MATKKQKVARTINWNKRLLMNAAYTLHSMANNKRGQVG